MKSRFIYPFLLIVSFALSVQTQEMPDWKYLSVEQFQIEDREALEELLTTWKSFLQEETEDPPGWDCYTDTSGRAYLLAQLDHFGEIHEREKVFREHIEEYQQEDRPDLWPLWFKSSRASTASLWKFRPDLSYVNGPLDFESQPFRRIYEVHLKRDEQAAWEETMKAMNKLDRELDLKTPRFVFECHVGEDLPMVTLVVPAKDQFDYYQGLEQRNQKRSTSSKWAEIQENLFQHARTVDHRHLTYQPDLSLQP